MATDSSAPVVPEPQSLDAGRIYIVFTKNGPEPATTGGEANPNAGRVTWQEIGERRASSPTAALEAVVGALPEAQRKGTFVAIASKYWSPVPVSEKVERTLVIGG